MKKFNVRYETTSAMGWISYENENEMYADLEVQGITEENPDVLGIDYYELTVLGNGTCSVSRRWDFGKPYFNDSLRKVI